MANAEYGGREKERVENGVGGRVRKKEKLKRG